MKNVPAFRFEPSLDRSLLSHASEIVYCQPQPVHEGRGDYPFIALLDGYRDSGGLAPLQEVAAQFQRRSAGEPGALARWIVNQQVICFEWQSKMWLPLFQFNRLDMSLQPGISLVLAQLGAALDDWQLAQWFVRPNPWLADRTPAAMLALDPAGVLNAAQADRQTAHGLGQGRQSLPFCSPSHRALHC